MDIYDKMCFTVSSAGGRRGAQMGTFDVGHPDAMEFIRAKREAGRLRQFNLSLLVTDEFMHAVRSDKDWNLAFPLLTKEYDAAEHNLDDATKFVWREWPIAEKYVTREDGLVCCKIYKTLPARRMWDVIMTSTYDFAEPGFILIDRVNEMNNNWWCENIRATNPCVTADTWVQTREGPRQVAELIGKPFTARVDGVDHASAPEGFFRTALKPLVQVSTSEGYSLRLTADHRVRRISTLTRWRLATEWCAAGDLQPGDKVLLQDHRAAPSWRGSQEKSQERAIGGKEGYVIGLLVGDGVVHGGRRRARGLGARVGGQQRSRRRRPELGDGRGARCRAFAQRRILRLAQGPWPWRIPLLDGRDHRSRARSRAAPGSQHDHAGGGARVERVLSRLPARPVRRRWQRAGNAGQGRVRAPRAIGPAIARGRAAHAAASRHRLDHLPQPPRFGPRPRDHGSERRAFRGARRFRRHDQALAPARPAGQLQAHAEP